MPWCPLAQGTGSPPTVFPDLNELLQELVARVRSILDENFVGAYVVGSFALGGGDLQSDCDFLVVTGARVTPAQERELRELHAEIPSRSGHWPHDLEGSYAPRADLETLEALEQKWLYVDRGHREMKWSTHCNSEDVRWTLREHGITLAGTEARQFVAEVPADVLRTKMRVLIGRFLPDQNAHLGAQDISGDFGRDLPCFGSGKRDPAFAQGPTERLRCCSGSTTAFPGARGRRTATSCSRRLQRLKVCIVGRTNPRGHVASGHAGTGVAA